MKLSIPPNPKFLIIRRDNIGDLVCTTPLIRQLREKFPDATIDALVNSYNEPVLENNPDVNEVYAYTKAKHRPKGKTVLGVYWDRLKLIFHLRQSQYDFAIVASTHFLPKPLALARQVRPRHIVGFVEGKHPAERYIDVPVPYVKDRPMHLVEELSALLQPLGIEAGVMPPMRVFAASEEIAIARERLMAQGWLPNKKTVAVHISARKVPQRWPTENFVALMKTLRAEFDVQFILFWSPGNEDNPLHPGDDQKALLIQNEAQGMPLYPFPTHTLKELIAGLSLCESVVCSDGGAMHLAAALGKPIVCLFGNSDATVWYPWGVPHRLLQKTSRRVSDISKDEVSDAFKDLIG